MLLNFWPVLIPIASVCGFYIGKSEARLKYRQSLERNTINEKYVQGLNFLLNDKPDKAIDVLIEVLDVDSETVETHLALGSLFRSRGEVDRATRIHQNLIARPLLNTSQRIEALMALGRDYMCAGVLDRAERIFNEVGRLSSKSDKRYLFYLLDIYQQQRGWQQALEVLSRLQLKSDQSYHHEISQCYCELALEQMHNDYLSSSYDCIKKAFQYDRLNVRASLLLGKLEMKQGHFHKAIKAFKRIPEQDSAFISEMIQPLAYCYKQIDNSDGAIKYFEYLLLKYPRTSVIFKIAEHIKETKGIEEALDYASDQLSVAPSLKGLNQLLAWYLEITHGKVKAKLNMLYKITDKLVKNSPTYSCINCGISGNHHHWRCPSCKRWNTVKPIAGLKGD